MIYLAMEQTLAENHESAIVVVAESSNSRYRAVADVSSTTPGSAA
jgi:hypothetical protein